MFKTFISHPIKFLIIFPTKTNAKFTFIIFIRITRQGFIAWVFGPSTFIASFNQFTVIIFILAKTEKRNELFSSLKSRYVGDERSLDWVIFQGKPQSHKQGITVYVVKDVTFLNKKMRFIKVMGGKYLQFWAYFGQGHLQLFM